MADITQRAASRTTMICWEIHVPNANVAVYLEDTVKATETSKISQKKLAALIDEATVDAHDEDEQLMGLMTAVVDEVDVPFEAKAVGEAVTVVGFDDGPGLTIQAICKRNKRKYKVGLSSLEWLTPKPKGFEWIAAYLEWQRRLG